MKVQKNSNIKGTRGRPRLLNPLSGAERARLCRQRKKAAEDIEINASRLDFENILPMLGREMAQLKADLKSMTGLVKIILNDQNSILRVDDDTAQRLRVAYLQIVERNANFLKE
jgi:hypothetical protein